MEGRSRIDLEAAQQCLTCRKVGLFTERHYKEAWSAGRVAEILQASARESRTLSGVRVRVDAINRTSSVLIWG